jgi:hypothetical protein
MHSDSAADSGLVYTETITTNYEPVMQYFNVTIQNSNGTAIYANIVVNGVTIATNQSVASGSNYTANAVPSTSFNLPGNQTINITITDQNGVPGPAWQTRSPT